MTNEEIKNYAAKNQQIIDAVLNETCDKYLATFKLFKDNDEGLRLVIKTSSFYFARRLKEETKKAQEETIKEITSK